jgi:hypothetical protein
VATRTTPRVSPSFYRGLTFALPVAALFWLLVVAAVWWLL